MRYVLVKDVQTLAQHRGQAFLADYQASAQAIEDHIAGKRFVLTEEAYQSIVHRWQAADQLRGHAEAIQKLREDMGCKGCGG